MPSSTRCGCSARIWRSLKVPGSDSSALQIVYCGCGSWPATISHFWPVGKPAPPMPAQLGVLQRRDDLLGAQVAGERAAEDAVVLVVVGVRVVRAALVRAAQRLGLAALAAASRRDRRLGLVDRQRPLVDGRGRRDVAPPEAGDLDDLDLDVVAVPLLRLADAVVGAVQPAREVVADGELDRLRRRRAEVRIERDHALDLVQRPAHVARQRDELLARQPADAPLDRGEGRDQARARELARPRLGAGIARLDPQAGPRPLPSPPSW